MGFPGTFRFAKYVGSLTAIYTKKKKIAYGSAIGGNGLPHSCAPSYVSAFLASREVYLQSKPVVFVNF